MLHAMQKGKENRKISYLLHIAEERERERKKGGGDWGLKGSSVQVFDIFPLSSPGID